MVSPTAEVEIDARLVRALLTEQHPDLADLPVALLAAGWDNDLWRVSADLEHRALGWAALFGVMFVAIGLDDRPTYAPIGRLTLDHAIAAVSNPRRPS